jgi:hypothetical protein
MKKIYLLVVMALVTTLVGAQTMNYMNVDSVRVHPANPTPSDSVFLHVYWNSPWGCSLNGTPTVNTAGLNHSASFCYTVGMITVVTSGEDSVFLFQGPAGFHVVSWQIFQNATFNSQCDWVRDANQQMVNVLATDIEEPEPVVAFDFVNGEFRIHANGSLNVYNALGQSVYNAQANSGDRIPFSSENTQIFIAVFYDQSGNRSTMKFTAN